MYIPEDVIQAKRKRYLRDGKPIHRPELQNDSEYDIIIRYQGEYRGLVQYYGLAQNLAQLGYVTCIPHFCKRIACERISALIFIMRCRHEQDTERDRV